MPSGHLLSALLLTPSAGALTVFCMKREHELAVKCVATASAIVALMWSILLWARYDGGGPTWQFAERIDLLSAGGLTFALGVDGFSISLVTLTTLIAIVALLASWKDVGRRAKNLFALLLVLEASVVGVLLTTNLLLYFLCSIGAMVTMTVLVASWSTDRRGSIVTRVSLHMTIAPIALLAGILLLAFHARSTTGVAAFDMVRLLELTIPADRQRAVFICLFVSFAIMMAMFPLQTWLSGAVEHAPAGGVLFLAAAMLKLGTYGLMRISLPLLPDATRHYVPFVTGLAVVTIVASLALALRHRSWKPVVAYTSAAAIAASLIAMFRLTPNGVSAAIFQQLDQTMVVGMIALAIGLRNRDRQQESEPLRFANPRIVLTLLVLATAALSGLAVASSPGRRPVYQHLLETSVGRVVARVNPAYAPLVKQPSDCGSPAAPVQPSSSAPAGWVTTQPCSEPGQTPKPTEHK